MLSGGTHLGEKTCKAINLHDNCAQVHNLGLNYVKQSYKNDPQVDFIEYPEIIKSLV